MGRRARPVLAAAGAHGAPPEFLEMTNLIGYAPVCPPFCNHVANRGIRASKSITYRSPGVLPRPTHANLEAGGTRAQSGFDPKNSCDRRRASETMKSATQNAPPSTEKAHTISSEFVFSPDPICAKTGSFCTKCTTAYPAPDSRGHCARTANSCTKCTILHNDPELDSAPAPSNRLQTNALSKIGFDPQAAAPLVQPPKTANPRTIVHSWRRRHLTQIPATQHKQRPYLELGSIRNPLCPAPARPHSIPASQRTRVACDTVAL